MSKMNSDKRQRTLSPELLHLLQVAREARNHAYAKYSQFYVGSAVLTDDNRVVVGANVENVSYGLTICAERNAITRAIIEKFCKLKAIAVCANICVSPCGACRQVMREFADEDCFVILGAADPSHEPVLTTVGELLPLAFETDLLGTKQ